MSNPSADDYSFDVEADVMISGVRPLDGTIGAMGVDLIYQGTKVRRGVKRAHEKLQPREHLANTSLTPR